MEKKYLVLSNGLVFPGRRIGAAGESTGELVFTTGMTGYLETLSDPSYAGQIILQTFPLIGNYGLISVDFEGEPLARGYVVRELCDTPSNFRSEGCLDDFLRERGIPGICGVDTRAITRLLREEGTMNARICDAVPEDLSAIRAYRVENAVELAGGSTVREFPAQGVERFHVALLDYGAKRNIVRSLTARGCRVTVLPHTSSAADVLAQRPDGLMLSNGPGDPADNVYEIAQLKKLLGELPVFGICLGHQLTALAAGGETVKLHYGHRGSNQPVRRLSDGRCFITSQNHGYAVRAESMPSVAKLSYINANDRSCEGLDYPGLGCFTVQFHPEACAGPRDTDGLFDRFFAMMGGDANAQR